MVVWCRLLEEIEDAVTRHQGREERTRPLPGDMETVLLEKRDLTRRLG
jgi:hypothetical protein